jgi:anti-repressor protein
MHDTATPKGKQCRGYFLEIERRWNSPKQSWQGHYSCQSATKSVRNQNKLLDRYDCCSNQQIAEMKPKVSYYDSSSNCKDLISTSAIAKITASQLFGCTRYLNKKGHQFKQGGIWLFIRSMQKRLYQHQDT